MIASILLSGLGLLVAMVGMKCTTCLADAPEQKDKVAIAGGVFFIVAGQQETCSVHISNPAKHEIDAHRERLSMAHICIFIGLDL